MNKQKSFILLILTLCLCVFTGFAFAQEAIPIVCSIEISPAKIPTPGPVTVTITIANSSDVDMTTPVVLHDPLAKPVQDFGTNGEAILKAGESITWQGTYEVNQNTLDNGIISYYAVYYDNNGQKKNISVRGKVGLQTEEAAIDVKRTITPSMAKEGQKVVVLYEITNTGTLNIEKIVVAEHKDITSKKQTIPLLKPGQKATIEYPITMKKKNITSGATISYRPKGKSETLSYTVENKIIRYGEAKLSATLTSSAPGVKQNETVTLTLTMVNDGVVDFSDIRVSDPTLGEVFSNQSVAAGKTLTLEKEITLTETSDYVFTVDAVEAEGFELQLVTDKINVVAVAPEDMLTLSVEAIPEKTVVYETPGVVQFRIFISNTSRVQAKDVKVMHGKHEIYTYETIEAGETRTLIRDMELSTAGKYRFSAIATDVLGVSNTFEGNDMQIAFEKPTPPPPAPTPVPQPTAIPQFVAQTMPPITDASIAPAPKLIMSILHPFLIVVAILLLLVLLLLIVAYVKRIMRKVATNHAVDQLERTTYRDYKDPLDEEIIDEEIANDENGQDTAQEKMEADEIYPEDLTRTKDDVAEEKTIAEEDEWEDAPLDYSFEIRESSSPYPSDMKIEEEEIDESENFDGRTARRQRKQ